MEIIKFTKEGITPINWKAINILKENGFKVLAFCTLMCEDTFFFGSKEMADKAFKQFEGGDDRRVVGWWYGIEELESTIKLYEKDNKSDVLIFYL